jgi:hypothetical protein
MITARQLSDFACCYFEECESELVNEMEEELRDRMALYIYDYDYFFDDVREFDRFRKHFGDEECMNILGRYLLIDEEGYFKNVAIKN